MAVLAATLAVAGPAHAERRPFNVGVIGGFHLTSADYDLLGDRSRVVSLANTGIVGARAGYRVVGPVGLELTLGVVPIATNETAQSGIAMPVTLDAIVYPFEAVVEPYLAAGGGFIALLGGDLGSDTDALIDVALGARMVLDERVAVRLEVRLFASDAVDAAMAPNLLFNLGVDLLAGDAGASASLAELEVPDAAGGGDPSADTDSDGVADGDDLCPASPGVAGFEGCPDTDADGLPDIEDACPTSPGEAVYQGCPDADRDGVVDGRDACPRERGVASRYGCPAPQVGADALPLGALAGVSFRRSSASLSASAFAPLAQVAEALLQQPDVRIELLAFVPLRDKAKALTLSHSRAQAVAAHLTRLGVEPHRIRATGKGADKGKARIVLKRVPTVQLLD